MALPSPVATLPDFTAGIEAARGRANDLMKSAWMSMAGMAPRPEAPPPQDSQILPGQAAAPGAMSREMLMWQNPQQAQSLGFGGRDDYSAMGFADNVPRSLIGTESSGNFGAANNVRGAGGATGHDGILQFGPARRSEAVAAGIIPEMSRDEFRANKQAQVAVSNWHFNDIDSRIRKAGFDQMIGQTIGGAPISMNGMRAMAHLGGFGGLSKFINSGGGYNPADAYGTSLLDYAIKHRG